MNSELLHINVNPQCADVIPTEVVAQGGNPGLVKSKERVQTALARQLGTSGRRAVNAAGIRKRGPAPAKTMRLEDAGTSAVIELVVNGTTYRDIAARFGVSPATLVLWIEANSERSRACARAREFSAQAFEERAEEELRNATNLFELARARELAAHWRWRAKAVNPRLYGDRLLARESHPISELTDLELEAKLATFGIILQKGILPSLPAPLLSAPVALQDPLNPGGRRHP